MSLTTPTMNGVGRAAGRLVIGPMLACLLLRGDCGAAEEPPRSSDELTRLVLNTGGPVGRVWSLAFSADGCRLYSGGEDKAVHQWLIPNGEPSRARYDGPLRWPVARADRGLIYTIAASRDPTTHRLAIGGTSAWGVSGDIILWDTRLRQVPQGGGLSGYQGHYGHAVVRLSFSPNGRRIASVSADRRLVLWSREERDGPPGWQPRQLRDPLPRPFVPETFLPVTFLDDDTIAAAQPHDDGRGNRWRIELYDVNGGTWRPLPGSGHRQVVRDIARAPAGTRWASADWDGQGAGQVFLWEGIEAPRLIGKFGWRDHAALSMAMSSNGLLAMTVQRNNYSVELQLWDVAPGRDPRLLDTDQVASHSRLAPVALSRDGSLLAVSGSATHEVLLFRIDRSQKQPLRNAAKNGRLMSLRGRGTRARRVRFLTGDRDGEYRLGLDLGQEEVPAKGAGRARSYREFDFTKTTLEQPDQEPAWDPVRRSLNWPSELPAGASEVELELDGRPVGTVDVVGTGVPRCSLHIPDREGGSGLMAVGTTGQNGIYIYRLPSRLPPVGTPITRLPRLPLVRHYRGHEGAVRSLSLSPDGKYLASSSDDRTIKVWSLEGIERTSPTFANYAGWGCEFSLGAGGVIIGKVMPPSIAASRGLEDGAVITQVWYGPETLDGAGDILATLRDHPLTDLVNLTIRQADAVKTSVPVVPGWEPLLTLFIDGDEWATWTPEGFFDSSLGEGAELFSYQINGEWNGTPRVLSGAEMEEEFRIPGLFRELLSIGNVPDALSRTVAAAKLARMRPLHAWPAQVAGRIPLVTVHVEEGPAPAQAGGPPTAGATVTVDYPLDSDPDRFDVRAFLSGSPMVRKPIDEPAAGPGLPKRSRRVFKFEGTQRGEVSRLKVIASGRDGLLCKEEVRLIPADDAVARDPNAKYRLHVLALAADNYGPDPGLLKYAVRDCESVIGELERRSRGGGHFEIKIEDETQGGVSRLYNVQLTRDNVRREVERLATALQASHHDELLVVFLAGHGMVHEGGFFFLTPQVRPNKAPETIRRHGIPWETFAPLTELPCRKLFVLDACRSGDLVADLEPAVRQLERRDCLVLTSTAKGQLAKERGDAGPVDDQGHGVFTGELLTALASGKPDGWTIAGPPAGREFQDGDLSLLELATYLRVVVPRTYAQRPSYMPRDLWDLLDIPFARVPAGVPAGALGGE